MENLYIDKIESKVWSGYIVATDRGLSFVSHETRNIKEIIAWQIKYYPDSKLISDSVKIIPYKKQFEQYLAGERLAFDIPIDVKGTPFQKEVWDILYDIPYGETRSYLDVAHKMGRDQKSAQAVGGAVARNPISLVCPCHRVVGSDGSLTGYSGGMENKIALLNHEIQHRVGQLSNT